MEGLWHFSCSLPCLPENTNPTPEINNPLLRSQPYLMYSFPISCMLDPFPISFPPSIDVFQLLSQLALLSLLLFCFQLSLLSVRVVYLVLFHCLGVGRCGIRRYGVCSSSFKGAVSKKAKHRSWSLFHESIPLGFLYFGILS